MFELNIKIDPQNLDKNSLLATAAYLASLAGHWMGFDEQTRQAVKPVIQKPSLPAITPPAAPVSLPESLAVPRAPTPPVVPSAPVAPPAPLSASGDVDSNGEVWDSKIHTRTKSKNTDGTWKIKRSLDPSEIRVTSVEDTTEEESELLEELDVFAGEDKVMTAKELGGLMVKAIREGKLTHTQVIEVLKSEGLMTLPSLSQRPELVPVVYKKLSPYFA